MPTLLVCSQCGHGHYCTTTTLNTYACTRCGWEVIPRHDILPNLEEGETLTLVDGLLAVVTA